MMMQTPKKFSIKEIAKLAGCSTSTVSNVLNEKGFFGEEIKKRVLKVCAELNYTPNALARNLRIGRTETIGLIFSRTSANIFRSMFYLEMIDHLQAALAEMKYDLLLSEFKTPENGEPFRFPRVVSQGKVDGIIVLGGMPRTLLHSLSKTDLKILLLDSFHEDMDSIETDNYNATYAMTEKLAKLGHKTASYFAYAYEEHNIQVRIKGFLDAAKVFGMKANVHANFYNLDDASGIFDEDRKKNKPTAILCVNDDIAFHMMNHALESGIKIPEELNIFGYDNTNYSTMGPLGISTASVDIKKMARLGAEMMIDRINNPGKPPSQVRINPELILRDTTGKGA